MRWRRSRILKTVSRPPLMALIDPAPIGIRIKELHSKKILISMCLFWLEARFAFCDWFFWITVNTHIRVVATTPEKTHNQKFLTFETILNRFLVQFYPGSKKKKKKKKKKLPPLYIDQLKCGIRPPPRPPPPTPPTLFGGPLCERTERDRDMKISGFVYLDTADALKYVRIWSEDLKGPLRP